MVICLFRSPDRDQAGSTGVCRLPQASAGRWFHDDAILRLCASLSQFGECRRTHQASAESAARIGTSQHPTSDGQAVWQYAKLCRHQKAETQNR